MAFPMFYAGIIRAARRVFRLGNVSYAAALCLLETAVITITSLWSCGSDGAIWISSTYAVSIGIAFTFLSGTGASLDARRTTWLVALSQAPAAIVPAALAPFGQKAFIWGLAASLHAVIYLRALSALAMTMETGRAVLSCVAPMLVLYWPWKNGSIGWFLLIPPITAALSLWLTLETEDRISRRLVGQNALDSVRAITRLLLVGDPEPLEAILSTRARPGKVGIFVLRAGEEILVAPDFHPGPIGDAGSSNGPYHVMNMLEDRGLKPAFLRRVCTHARNLPSRWWVKRVAEKALELLRGAEPVEVGAPVIYTNGNVEVIAQRFGRYVLISLSGWPADMEDFPETVELRLRERTKASLNEVVPLVVDRHDSLGLGQPKHIEPYGPEESMILERAWSALADALKADAKSEVMVGFGVKRDESLLSVGPGGVRVLTIKAVSGAWAIAYVVIDGNNMLPELRAKLCSLVEAEGYIPVIATTDTHYTLSPDLPINPVGTGGEEDTVVELVREALAEATESESRSKIHAGYGEMDVMLVGKGAVDSISLAAVIADHAAPLIALGSAGPLIPMLLEILL